MAHLPKTNFSCAFLIQNIKIINSYFNGMAPFTIMFLVLPEKRFNFVPQDSQ